VSFCALSTHAVNHSFEVRPYATDLLLTIVILLAARMYLSDDSRRARRWAAVSLLAAAALAPWLSFASAFVLAAASLALLVDYWRKRERQRFVYWAGFNAVLLATSFFVWFVQARHLYYPGLKDEWTIVWGGFPRNYAAQTVLVWSLQAPERVAHYASTGLGVPLLLLGMAGLVRCWRRSVEECLLLAGPLFLAYFAALAGKYPFADRTLFFLAPCVWLLATEGLLFVAESVPQARIALPVLVLGLMAPGLASTVKFCYRVKPKMEYREALAYVHDQRGEDDAVWNWCTDLNAVYCNHIFPWQPAGGDPADPDAAVHVAGSRPLWVISPDNRVDEMTDPLRSQSVRQTLCRQFLGVKVIRFDPTR
jgi:hypothetical protein